MTELTKEQVSKAIVDAIDCVYKSESDMIDVDSITYDDETNSYEINGSVITDDRIGYPKNQAITINNEEYYMQVWDSDTFPDGTSSYEFYIFKEED